MLRIQRTRLRIRAAPLTSRNQADHESTSTRRSHNTHTISAHSHVYMGGAFYIRGDHISQQYTVQGGQYISGEDQSRHIWSMYHMRLWTKRSAHARRDVTHRAIEHCVILHRRTTRPCLRRRPTLALHIGARFSFPEPPCTSNQR